MSEVKLTFDVADPAVARFGQQTLALERERLEAMVAADIDTLERILAEGLVYVHGSGASEGKADYLSKLRTGHVRYLNIAVSVNDVRQFSDVAMVLATMRAVAVSGSAPRQLHARYLGVWTREPAGWRFSLYQPTPIVGVHPDDFVASQTAPAAMDPPLAAR